MVKKAWYAIFLTTGRELTTIIPSAVYAAIPRVSF
jgi:hypothetical protein